MFITFEGIDGAGKSTQVELLRAALAGEGRDVVVTREPGGTELGEEVRRLLLEGPELSGWTEAALFAAARAELVHRVISPALARGADVVCDRYVDSSLAYQGIARGLGVDRVLELSLTVVGGVLPDRTYVLLVDPVVALGRLTAAPDRIEREGSDFLRRVDRAYRALAETFPDRILALDAGLPAGDLARLIRDDLRSRV